MINNSASLNKRGETKPESERVSFIKWYFHKRNLGYSNWQFNRENSESDFEECNYDRKRILKTIRNENPNKLIPSHLNINPIRNKFELLINQIKGAVEVLMISETKIDHSFPTPKFLIDGFGQPYGADQNSFGGRTMFYVRESIPSSFIKIESLPIGFYIELKWRNEKWLISGSYNPHRNATSNYLEALRKVLHFHSSSYNDIIILNGFNVGAEEPFMKTICESYSFKSLIKQPTCYENPSRPTCIDLTLTNVPRCFQSLCFIETDLSDFHLLTLTVIKKAFKKFQPT